MARRWPAVQHAGHVDRGSVFSDRAGRRKSGSVGPAVDWAVAALVAVNIYGTAGAQHGSPHWRSTCFGSGLAWASCFSSRGN